MPTMLGSASEPRHVLPLLVAEPGRLAGPGVLAHPLWAAGRGDRTAHPPVGEDELEERLRPGLDAELAQRFELAPRRNIPHEAAAAEGDHRGIAPIAQTCPSSTSAWS